MSSKIRLPAHKSFKSKKQVRELMRNLTQSKNLDYGLATATSAHNSISYITKNETIPIQQPYSSLTAKMQFQQRQWKKSQSTMALSSTCSQRSSIKSDQNQYKNLNEAGLLEIQTHMIDEKDLKDTKSTVSYPSIRDIPKGKNYEQSNDQLCDKQRLCTLNAKSNTDLTIKIPQQDPQKLAEFADSKIYVDCSSEKAFEGQQSASKLKTPKSVSVMLQKALMQRRKFEPVLNTTSSFSQIRRLKQASADRQDSMPSFSQTKNSTYVEKKTMFPIDLRLYQPPLRKQQQRLSTCMLPQVLIHKVTLDDTKTPVTTNHRPKTQLATSAASQARKKYQQVLQAQLKKVYDQKLTRQRKLITYGHMSDQIRKEESRRDSYSNMAASQSQTQFFDLQIKMERPETSGETMIGKKINHKINFIKTRAEKIQKAKSTIQIVSESTKNQLKKQQLLLDSLKPSQICLDSSQSKSPYSQYPKRNQNKPGCPIAQTAIIQSPFGQSLPHHRSDCNLHTQTQSNLVSIQHDPCEQANFPSARLLHHESEEMAAASDSAMISITEQGQMDDNCTPDDQKELSVASSQVTKISEEKEKKIGSKQRSKKLQ